MDFNGRITPDKVLYLSFPQKIPLCIDIKSLFSYIDIWGKHSAQNGEKYRYTKNRFLYRYFPTYCPSVEKNPSCKKNPSFKKNPSLQKTHSILICRSKELSKFQIPHAKVLAAFRFAGANSPSVSGLQSANNSTTSVFFDSGKGLSLFPVFLPEVKSNSQTR